MSLLENVKQICKENNVSVPKLEKELELGSGSIYKWDSSFPAVDKVQRVADYFSISVDYLLGRTSFRFDDSSNSKKLNSIIGALLNEVNESVRKRELPNLSIVESLKILAELTVYKLDKG
ncbi:hypothetical protein [Desulfosporosinus nitroreducens]|uniref:hypothetical protein n=1 Tax=Desulfosporosinus nitroreducens TaxID=2018668 RepID=UPI00207D6364|nr:hypothetical protein [Desulfosporosinus nitroreducens]MCO1599874.1 hypothetical protein [Desulfosporosinus nitroreducens]